MAHYRSSESKREQFRRYLEKAGVLDSLTSVLVTLYETTDKPSDALDFLKQHLGMCVPNPADTETLRQQLRDARQSWELLDQEHQELKRRLQRYESASNNEAASSGPGAE
ncbi:c-Myc-binding protein-like [Osmerus eperlanus]|uniref:c-Myc-binding protein-like n=1 Tax=Osmerus eperlanus TaxID=29151 RepID=UPI002E12867F